MSNPIEIEKKFRVNQEQLGEFLNTKKYISSKRVVDEYLDTHDGLYYQDGIYIRLRNDKSLDIKFNPDHLGNKNSQEHTICHEYNISMPFEPSSTQVFESLSALIPIKRPSPYSYDEFLKINDLQTLMVLDKNRQTYEDDVFVIAVDTFADFGTFLELEAKDNSICMVAFLAEISKATQGLELQEINSGYIEMRLRETNRDLYLKGKYLLDEDLRSAA